MLAIAVDTADLLVRDLVDLGGVPDYQSLDKWLDQVYMGCFLVVALRWAGIWLASIVFSQSPKAND